VVAAAAVAVFAGLIGGWLGAKWSRNTTVKTLEASFADTDRRDRQLSK